jgi:hypothetical protein
MPHTPKRIKRLLREYAATAHEEELRRALLPVSEAFGRWARRELSSGELSEIIHRFHQGPARELWVRYNTSHLEMPVAFAITNGVLARETVPAEVLEHLAGALRFYEEVQADASRDRDHELEKHALISREPSNSGMAATPQVYQFKLVLVAIGSRSRSLASGPPGDVPQRRPAAGAASGRAEIPAERITRSYRPR